VGIWKDTAGRFLEFKETTQQWTPIMDHNVIVKKMQRNIDRWSKLKRKQVMTKHAMETEILTPMKSEYCFGPGTDYHSGNKALKHIAHSVACPLVHGNHHAALNASGVIADMVVGIWKDTGGRFLEFDFAISQWISLVNHNTIVEKLWRSIDGWKREWK